MRTTVIAALITLLASEVSSRLAPGAEQEGQFRLDVSGIAVHAIVRDGNRPIAGLTSQDFALTDSGVPQTVTAVPGSSLPIDLSVVAQQTIWTGGYTRETYQPQIDEVIKLLTDRDRLQLVAVGNDIREILSLSGAARSAGPVPADDLSCRAILDALASVMMRTTDPSRQHAVILLAESQGGGNVLSYEVTNVIAKRSDATLYTLVTEPSSSSPTNHPLEARYPMCAQSIAEWTAETKSPLRSIEGLRSQPSLVFFSYGRERLAKLAEATGGREIPTALFSKSIAGPVQHVLDELRSSYTLYYQPKGVPAGGWHPISVTLTRTKGNVHARPGYAR
jgi:hypothetical protein